jgi:hypothetical protein
MEHSLGHQKGNFASTRTDKTYLMHLCFQGKFVDIL